MRDLYLAADIGGTKSDLGLYRVEGGKTVTVRESTVPTSSYGSVSGILDTFLIMEATRVKAACIAVAGHVRDGIVNAPNLPWGVSLEKLKASLEISDVSLINDLVATAWGTLKADTAQIVTFQDGFPDPLGTRALIAPGTGLGECIIACVDGHFTPIPTEGGHSDFAPTGELQVSLLHFAAKRFNGHVSWERIVSGNGLKLIYDFIVENELSTSNLEVAALIDSRDPVPVITDFGVNGTDPACSLAVDLFLEILGAEAGNLALKSLSTGGLFLSGGMWIRLMPRLVTSKFLASFTSKGRMTGLMASIPIRSAAIPKIALGGAKEFVISSYS